MPGRFAETVGLDDSFDFFFLGKNPDLGAGSAGGFYAVQVARPGRLQCQAGTKPPNPHSPPRPCYMCYVLYGSHKASH